ncbi:UNVERIFIED_CONTAM: hypothetical protein NCL1_14922 [Trichonephila clavipes]
MKISYKFKEYFSHALDNLNAVFAIESCCKVTYIAIRSHCTTEPLSGDSNGEKYKRYCPCREGLACETPERYRQSLLI